MRNARGGNVGSRCWLGTALDGQTDSVKKNRIRLFVVNPSAVIGKPQHGGRRQN
jgi:hypothetical protein